jgi:MYXO-CTERM domain-containing protein
VTVAGATGPESFNFEFTPEPTSAGLAGIGALALGALRRRRVA